MKVLVTGGAGNVGQGVVAYLARKGHQVRVVDWRLNQRDSLPGVEYNPCDITDFSALREQACGQEAIVHLAAFPYPGAAPGPDMFRVNCSGAYNLFEAAAAEGIRRVSCASSINALGYNYGVKSFPIRYFPIDEDHPTLTTDPYSFSKQTLESIASYYWRRDGISSTCLRMPFVYTVDQQMSQMAKGFMQNFYRLYRDLAALPAPERRAQVDQLLAGLEEQRANRVWEKPFKPAPGESEEQGFDLDNPALLLFGYTDFWAILSVEDAAQAFEQSLLADFEGSHPLFLSERSNSLGLPSEELLSCFYPQVTERRQPLPNSSSLVSFEKAHRLIGYEPRHNVIQRLGLDLPRQDDLTGSCWKRIQAKKSIAKSKWLYNY